MNELIWFSIPGAICLIAFYLVFPRIGPQNEVITVALAPVVGYVIHQTYRAIFESLRGWETPSRAVIELIRKEYKLEGNGRRLPFLIWEATFYSDRIPDAFREHNRGSWHYIISFRSVSFAAAISAVGVFLIPLMNERRQPILLSLVFITLGLLFWWKAKLTNDSLSRQECAAFWTYRPGFDESAKAIVPHD